MILSVKRGRGNKIHVFLDDVYRLTTGEKFFYSYAFSNKNEITEEEWAAFKEAADFAKLYDQAIRILSFRAHSEKEISMKLRKRDSSEQVERVIYKLVEQKLLSNENFAKEFAHMLIENKKNSKNFVKRELKLRGIDDYIIEDVLSDIDIDEVSSIIEVIKSKYRNYNLSEEKEKRKAYNFFLRKGYTYSDISAAFFRLDL